MIMVDGQFFVPRVLAASFRKPQRISVTLPLSVYKPLLERSDQEGRSLSNLAAWLLEQSVEREL